jgi:hypothetical protein
VRRIYLASGHFNKKYRQILKWGLTSREDTNFTYDLTPGNIKYLALTISAITGAEYHTVIKYIDEAQSDMELKNTIKTAISNSPFKRYADKEVRFGRRLGWYAFVRIMKPEIVVETGVDKGLGSILLCAALLRNKKEGFNGKYFGTDINPDAGYILSGQYESLGKILYGDSISSLSEFPDKIDLFINDSEHSADYEYQEYVTIKKLITDKTIILGDNSHSTCKLADFSIEMGRSFVFFNEKPLDHWYPGAGIGISYKKE